MGLKLRRRSVYAATGVAILAMVAGFALASGGFLGFGSTSVNGNQGAISTHGTIYQPGITTSLFTTGSAVSGLGTGDCGAAATAQQVGVTNLYAAAAWVSGGSSACGGLTDYVLQLNFTANASTSTVTNKDTFTVSSEFGVLTSTFTTESVLVICTVSSGEVCQADINIDTGVPTSDPQPAVEAVDVSVTGS
jgi:hypothetical protein